MGYGQELWQGAFHIYHGYSYQGDDQEREARSMSPQNKTGRKKTISLGRGYGAEGLATGPLEHRHEGNPLPMGEKDKSPSLGLH